MKRKNLEIKKENSKKLENSLISNISFFSNKIQRENYMKEIKTYGFEIWNGTTNVVMIGSTDFLQVVNEMLDREDDRRDGRNRYIGPIETWSSWEDFTADAREREGMY